MKAFRCSRTGVLFPPDFIENWGKKYGIGLGPIPVSEALVNDYLSKVSQNRDDERTMHPVGNCHAQVDCMEVTEEEFEANRAVLAIDDQDLRKRTAIMRGRQLVHSPEMQRLFPAESTHALELEQRRNNPVGG